MYPYPSNQVPVPKLSSLRHTYKYINWVMECTVMERDGDTSKRNGEAQHLQEEAKQLKGTIWLDAFSCHCKKNLIMLAVLCYTPAPFVEQLVNSS
jgi:hypothetical protein